MNSKSENTEKPLRKSIMSLLIGLMTILCFLLIPLTVLSQNGKIEELSEEELSEKKTVTVSELAARIQEDAGEVFLIDLRIVEGENDGDFLSDESFDPLYVISPDPKNESKARKINFFSCVIDVPVHFKSWTINKLNMLDCQLNESLTFESIQQSGNSSIHIENCLFVDALEFKNELPSVGKLEIQNCLFKKNVLIESDVEQLKLLNCFFNTKKSRYESEDSEKTHFQLSISAHSIGDMEINDCRFFTAEISNLFSVDFSESSIGNLSMNQNDLHSFNLSSATVEKSLLIDSLQVDTYIGILNFDFPDNNTNIPWYNLGGEKLAIFKKGTSELLFPYQAKTNIQLSSTLDYNDLISAYTKFNSLYHDRGDLQSANASYVETKTIETRRQGYMQQVNPSRNNWINYMLNVFLRDFSDYATNPGKSIVYSLWVLILFTVLYMFSFSGWDGINYRFYIGQVNVFSDYISSRRTMQEILDEARKEREAGNHELQDIRSEMEKYQKLNKKIPKVIKLVGEPIYFMGKFRFDIIPGMFKLFDFQKKSWSDLNDFGKLKSGVIFLVITFIFTIYVFFVKLFTSFMLSLNSFVVIGFGALPEEDRSFAMYLTIIEGIIGWFLLTIFTITLLSQVLQSAG